MDDRPIGMFDSGFGGLTVARAVMDVLPKEDLVYVGDTGRYPYGPRDLDEVRGFARQIASLLVSEHGAKLLVVACNTAASAGLDGLEAELGVPVVGVIEPGVRAAVRVTGSGRIGVIGTVGTISSGAYQRAVAECDPGVTLACAACPGFVEFVERGETGSEQVHVLAERLLSPLRDAGVDTLLLGCTHYPFLARTIGDVMGRDVVLVSSADETAFEVRAVLSEAKLEHGALEGTAGVGAPGREDRPSHGRDPRGASHRFLSSGDVAWFKELGAKFLGPELDGVESIVWDEP